MQLKVKGRYLIPGLALVFICAIIVEIIASRHLLKKVKLRMDLKGLSDYDSKNLNNEIERIAPIIPDPIMPQVVDANLEADVLRRLKFYYPPFVLSPPLIVKNCNETLPSVSSFYQSMLSGNRRAENAAKHITHQYKTWRCSDLKRGISCDRDENKIVISDKKYIRGRVDFIADGVLSDDYNCGWNSDYSISIRQKESSLSSYYVNGTVVFMIVPDGFSFQHFLDGILPKLVQIESLLRDHSVKYVVHTKKRFPIVKELLHRMGIEDTQMIPLEVIMPHSGRIQAKTLVLTCNTPPIHPYLWQRGQYLLQLPWLSSFYHTKKRVILYMSRNQGTYNSGRRVLNEEALFSAIEPLAQERDYRFVVFNAKNYGTLDVLVNFLSDVYVMIGPHGGALTNMMFIPRNATVIEMMPRTPQFTDRNHEVHLVMYKQSQLLGLKYFALFGEGDKSDNMLINPAIVVSCLESVLYRV